uniref:SCP domain-containing protein n=1 Tax=Timema genevievae TaxID=629358 RepID=A0A7R9JR03_TIMGE|nr:unnamed protein product [Timema genevievae]
MKILTLAVVVFHCATVLSYNYCDTSCDYCDTSCDKGQHTMCIYKQSPGPLCVEYEPRPLSQEEKEIIVNIHNRMRSDVALGKEMKGDPGPQPQASDMMQMVWDDELARIAQQWADQCTPVHDDCRNVAMFLSGQSLGIREMNVIFPYEIMVNMFVPAMFRSGQNLGIRGMDKGFPDEIMVNIDEWFNEVSLVQPDTVKQYPGTSIYMMTMTYRSKCHSILLSPGGDSTAMVGHYTQLVWSRSLYVGCGASLFLKDGTWYSEYLVCNYGPAGNVRTEPVYHQGPPCSACPNGTVCSDQYDGLCKLLYNERDSLLPVNASNLYTTTSALGPQQLGRLYLKLIEMLVTACGVSCGEYDDYKLSMLRADGA